MGSNRSDRHNTPPLQRRIAVITLVLLGILTLVIIYVSYHQEMKPTAFFARSIDDASYDCEAKIQSRYKARLISRYFDPYSSRYEADDHQYLVYYRVTIQEQDKDGRSRIRDLMVKCTVWEKLGYVSDFQEFNNF